MLTGTAEQKRKLFTVQPATPAVQRPVSGPAPAAPATLPAASPSSTTQPGSVPPNPVNVEPQTVTAATGSPLLSENVNRILGENSPILQRARARSQQTASSRGLLNSTMAAQAGEAAVIDAALPIAAGDTQHFQNLAGIQAQTSAELTLQEQAFQNNQQLLAQELANAQALSAQDQQELLAQLEQQHQYTLAEIEANVSADELPRLRQQYLSQAGAMMAATSAEVAAIYQTQGLTAAQQSEAVRQANQRLGQNLALLGDYYATVPGWDVNWTTSVGAPAPPANYSPDSAPVAIGDRFRRGPYSASGTGSSGASGNYSSGIMVRSGNARRGGPGLFETHQLIRT